MLQSVETQPEKAAGGDNGENSENEEAPKGNANIVDDVTSQSSVGNQSGTAAHNSNIKKHTELESVGIYLIYLLNLNLFFSRSFTQFECSG